MHTDIHKQVDARNAYPTSIQQVCVWHEIFRCTVAVSKQAIVRSCCGFHIMERLPRYNFRVRSSGLQLKVPFLQKCRGRLLEKAHSARKKLKGAKSEHVYCMWKKCKLDLHKAGGVQGRHRGFHLTSAHQKMAGQIGGLYKSGSGLSRTKCCRNIEWPTEKTAQATAWNYTH